MLFFRTDATTVENLWLKTEHCWLVFSFMTVPVKNKANRFSYYLGLLRSA